MSSFKLTVSSPNGDLFKGDAEKIILRGSEGDLAVMAGHIPFITAVQPCECRIYLDESDVRTGRLSGGLLTVSKDSTTLLAGDFEWTE